MRHVILVFTVFMVSHISHSQIYEVGVFGGGSNVIGDVGSTQYINPNSLAFGAIAKWNRSPRHSFRASVIFSKLQGKDSKSGDPRRQQRNYDFETQSVEISGGMEFTFLDFDLHDSALKVTPYLYTGITALHHDNYFFDANGIYTSENTSSWAWGIPMVVGVKANITTHFILALEVGFRYTFSDEIDGSVPDSPERSNLSFGNTNSNDWYNLTGLTLTYTFGRRPCYCNF
ncbi:type IX secretion system protein PorG [Winogradskyella aurantiaca]|uniref:type IX secretion system protein PorG n=1 Tax=Winogradskyella aurantiaca TaxID=2219558 RepID=UPI000E1D51C1|nr:DUF6089 family protein [Winogradskyella aurantiaca]